MESRWRGRPSKTWTSALEAEPVGEAASRTGAELKAGRSTTASSRGSGWEGRRTGTCSQRRLALHLAHSLFRHRELDTPSPCTSRARRRHHSRVCIPTPPAPQSARAACATSVFRVRRSRLEGGMLSQLRFGRDSDEVFLKAVALARNAGRTLDGLTTVNLDFLRHYRPQTNVVSSRRPVSAGLFTRRPSRNPDPAPRGGARGRPGWVECSGRSSAPGSFSGLPDPRSRPRRNRLVDALRLADTFLRLALLPQRALALSTGLLDSYYTPMGRRSG